MCHKCESNSSNQCCSVVLLYHFMLFPRFAFLLQCFNLEREGLNTKNTQFCWKYPHGQAEVWHALEENNLK